MALPDRIPPRSPHRQNFPPPSTYPERNHRTRGLALTDVGAGVGNHFQRLDAQSHDIQINPPRWISSEDHYKNEYLAGPGSSTDASLSERMEASPPPHISSNTPFYVPRSPPPPLPLPQYQNQSQSQNQNQNRRPDYRMDNDPGYEYDYRPQLQQGYQPPPYSDQHLLLPSYLQPPTPIYEPRTRWSDRQHSPDRSRPAPQPFMHAQPSRERLAPSRMPPNPPPPQPTVSMQRKYSQDRHPRATSSSRRHPYPSVDGRAKVSSSGRYQGGGGGGKRRFEKRNGHTQKASGY